MPTAPSSRSSKGCFSTIDFFVASHGLVQALAEPIVDEQVAFSFTSPCGDAVAPDGADGLVLAVAATRGLPSAEDYRADAEAQ